MNRTYKHKNFNTIDFDKSIKGFMWYSTNTKQPSGTNKMDKS